MRNILTAILFLATVSFAGSAAADKLMGIGGNAARCLTMNVSKSVLEGTSLIRISVVWLKY